MNPVPADVRELMYKVKKAQGTDISRSFCGLNDHRNLRLSVEYAKKAENKGKTIVALLPDSGDRYYSTPLFTE